mgnify:CR=1 FL=1
MGILPIPRCHKAFKSKRVKSKKALKLTVSAKLLLQKFCGTK